MSDFMSTKKRRGGKREKAPPKLPKPPKRVPSEEVQEDLTPEEYEKQKYDILYRAAVAERQYLKLRTRLKENKFKEAEDYKKQVQEGQCPEYLNAKKEAEDLKEKKRGINLVTREMKLAQIYDEFDAETTMNETQFDDNYVYAKGRFIEYFKNLIAEKQRREHDIMAVMTALLLLPPSTKGVDQPVLEEMMYEGRTTRSRSKSKAKEQKEESLIVEEVIGEDGQVVKRRKL